MQVSTAAPALPVCMSVVLCWYAGSVHDSMYGSECNASWTASMHTTTFAANISVRPSLCSWKQHQSNVLQAGCGWKAQIMT